MPVLTADFQCTIAIFERDSYNHTYSGRVVLNGILPVSEIDEHFQSMEQFICSKFRVDETQAKNGIYLEGIHPQPNKPPNSSEGVTMQMRPLDAVASSRQGQYKPVA